MMTIRQATTQDYKSIRMSLYNKKIDYITPQHAKEDIQNHRLFLLVENGKVLGQCALNYKTEFGEPYCAIQRMVLYNGKNKNKHLADHFITYFKSLNLGKLGVTPWSDNVRMKHILTKHGFSFEYQIDKNYEYWAFRG